MENLGSWLFVIGVPLVVGIFVFAASISDGASGIGALISSILAAAALGAFLFFINDSLFSKKFDLKVDKKDAYVMNLFEFDDISSVITYDDEYEEYSLLARNDEIQKDEDLDYTFDVYEQDGTEYSVLSFDSSDDVQLIYGKSDRAVLIKETVQYSYKKQGNLSKDIETKHDSKTVYKIYTPTKPTNLP